MSSSILVAQNLSKVVSTAEGELTILHGLDLDLPRGASLEFQGSGVIDAPVQFIAGTYSLRGGAQINPQPLIPGFSPMRIALVE